MPEYFRLKPVFSIVVDMQKTHQLSHKQNPYKKIKKDTEKRLFYFIV